MQRLLPWKQQKPAPYAFQPPLPPPPAVLRTHLITRPYSPKSRRTLRRILLAAEAHGLNTTIVHDHAGLFRLHLLTVTGPSPAVAAFRRRLDHVRPAVKPRWAP
ncbi:hypothetical protein [Nonomuraea glycinis]|uniref:hypothetical protein n=1 Tax=Nonomuraea glycinis TaxID=2047744 RepID=UPI00339FC9E1